MSGGDVSSTKFFLNEKIEGGHMDQNQDPIGQSFTSILTEEKVIFNEYMG